MRLAASTFADLPDDQLSPHRTDHGALAECKLDAAACVSRLECGHVPVHRAAVRLTGLHLADAGQQVPGQVAGRVAGAQVRGSHPVGE